MGVIISSRNGGIRNVTVPHRRKECPKVKNAVFELKIHWYDEGTMTATLNPEIAATKQRRVPHERIVSTPDTCLGKARIDGTRIKVSLIYDQYEKQGRAPEQIVENYPHLTLADVHAALAYAYAYREEIESQLDEEKLTAERFISQQPSIWEMISAKRPDVLQLSNAAAAAYIASGHCATEDISKLKAALSERPVDHDLPFLTDELSRR